LLRGEAKEIRTVYGDDILTDAQVATQNFKEYYDLALLEQWGLGCFTNRTSCWPILSNEGRREELRIERRMIPWQ
jgi:hypothetical protein